MWHAQAPLPPLRLAFERPPLRLTTAFARRTAHRACSHGELQHVGKQVGSRYAIAASAAALANRAQCMAADGCGGVQSTALRLLRLPLAI